MNLGIFTIVNILNKTDFIFIYFNRIHFSCPFCSSNGNSLYTIGRWIVGATIVLLLILSFVPLNKMFGSPYLNRDPASKADTNYGIVIDCGSSGSRVYVYSWPPHSGNPNELLDVQQLVDEKGEVVVKKMSPGEMVKKN